MNRIKLIFAITVWVSTIGQISSDLYLPSLPAIAHGLQVHVNLVQLTISIFLTGFTLSQLIYGPLSDAIGRKKPLLIGLLLGLIGSIICVGAINIHALILGRLLQGLGAGACSALFRPILRDMFSGAKLSQYGSYSGLVGVGFLAMAPLLGGYIQDYLGWRANFVFLTLYILLAFLTVILVVPETNKKPSPDHLKFTVLRSNLTTLLTSPTFIGYSICSLLTYGAVVAWISAGPIVLQNTVGMTPAEFGLAYGLTGITFAIGSFINIKFVGYCGIKRMLEFGLFTIFIAGCLMLGLSLLGYINSVVIVGPAMLLLLGAPLVFPNTFAGAFDQFPEIAGIAGAIFGSMRILGGVIVSALMAASQDQTQFPMSITLIGCAILAWTIFYFTVRRSKSA